MIERMTPKRNAISNPVESFVRVDTSEPARTTWPAPPACVASTLPWTIVASTSPPSPTSRCSYAPRLYVDVETTVPLASRTRRVTDAG